MMNLIIIILGYSIPVLLLMYKENQSPYWQNKPRIKRISALVLLGLLLFSSRVILAVLSQIGYYFETNDIIKYISFVLYDWTFWLVLANSTSLRRKDESYLYNMTAYTAVECICGYVGPLLVGSFINYMYSVLITLPYP